MANYQFVEQRFAFYKFGTYIADIIFNENGVMHRTKDIETNEWSSYKEYDEDRASYYQISITKIYEKFNEVHDTDWNASDEVILSSGQCYQRYAKCDGVIEGQKKETWIWALQGVKSPIDIIVCDNAVIAFVIDNPLGHSVLVRHGYEELTPLNLWNDSLLSKADHGIKHLGTFYINTRDELKLTADVWIPSGLSEEGRVPAVLVRTPYGRIFLSSFYLSFVQRGYALVVQDTRGCNDSEGEWNPRVHEIDDGDDTLNWTVVQPWCDGNIGMIGASYGGLVQWAAAASGNKNLKAIISQVSTGSPFIDFPRKGGTIASGVLAWSFMMSDGKINLQAAARDDWDEIIKIRPIKDIPKKVLGKDINFWDKWMEHPDNDEFWKKANWSIHGDKINVPALIVSGWYDDDGMGTTEAWEMNERNSRDNIRLVLGPWMHQFNTTREIHNVKFGNNAIRYDLGVLYLRWFDRFLKNIDNGVEKEPKVDYYMVGENEWKQSQSWPPKETEYINLYFHSRGNANTGLGDGHLEFISPDEQPKDMYVFDPMDAAPHLIDVSENELSVPENYKEVEKRKDVLVYTSEPLNEDVTIAGNINAVLYASSSEKDTDWVVRLTDVDEEGNSIRLVDGIIRARYRHSFEKPELLEPGKVERYEIRMSKAANVFKKGHRIRVSVTSGAKNLCFPNHNTGNNPMIDVEMVTATQTVYHDKNYPSFIKLPVLNKTI